MKKLDDLEKKVESALHSLDGMQRAVPQPFLMTRVNAALQNRRLMPLSFQEKIAAFISRPAVAFCILLMVLLINITVLVTRNSQNTTEVRDVTSAGENKEEFAFQQGVLFDIENP